MTSLILKRLGIGLVTVLAVSLIIFFGTKILPGDAAQIRLGQSATPENVAAFRARLGLDKPYIVQYLVWLKNFMTGDLGTSLASDVPISDLIADRYKNTVFVSALTAASLETCPAIRSSIRELSSMADPTRGLSFSARRLPCSWASACRWTSW